MKPLRLPDGPALRILIVRLSAIGDAVHGMPVLCALRDRFPEARIAWVVESRAAALLRGHAALDQLIELPRGWLKSLKTVRRLRRDLRAFRPDVAIDMQGLTKSAIVARLSGAKCRIGFGDEKGRELSRWFYNVKVPAPAEHVIDANLQLLGPLGIEKPTDVRFEIPEHEPDAAMADRTVDELGWSGKDFAIINPGAGWSSKVWPAERFAEVAARLGAELELPTLVVWAGKQEQQWAETIVAGSNGHATLAPPTSLTELAALSRRARLFIGSDTGPLHIAAGVGTSCVGLYGPMPAERNGPYGSGHVAIQKARFEGTSRERRTASPALMEAITVDDVVEACRRVLEK
ncbi:MAG: lipopolysaccharide heptosyltransferase I [Planctomycetia bacterium]|jgi:lipopolysaccharide heptosyltransferase I